MKIFVGKRNQFSTRYSYLIKLIKNFKKKSLIIMDLLGNYEVKTFKRIIQKEYVEFSRERYYMTGLMEIDITKARKFFEFYKMNNDIPLSFTAWVTKCVAQAVSENKEVQSIRKGKKIYFFDDVDVSMPVEKKIDGRRDVVILIIRKSNEKSLFEIHEEIREAQAPIVNQVGSSGINQKSLKLLLYLPRFLRNAILWNRMRRNPLIMKRYSGTVSMAAIGMFGKGKIGWGINLGHHPLCVVIGGISEQPRLIDGVLQNREFLNLTIKIDHIVTDGAPATRFATRLINLLEEAYQLEDYCKEQ